MGERRTIAGRRDIRGSGDPTRGTNWNWIFTKLTLGTNMVGGLALTVNGDLGKKRRNNRL